MYEKRRLRVFVYRNLHNGEFSLRDIKSGRVIAHSPTVLLENAVFKVYQSARNEVLCTHQKNIHAGVEGDVVFSGKIPKSTRQVRYNPYIADHFFFEKPGTPVTHAKKVLLRDGKCFVGV